MPELRPTGWSLPPVDVLLRMFIMAVRNDTWVTLKRLAGIGAVSVALSPFLCTKAAEPRPPSVSDFNDFANEVVSKGSDLYLEDERQRRAKANGHFAAGLIFELNRQSEKAFEQFHKAALADPSREKLVITVADRFIRRQQPERALEVLEKAVKTGKATGRMQGLLGIVYAELGRQQEAVDAIHKAIEESPDELPPYIFLAKAHRDKLDFAASLKALRDARKAVPDSQGNLFALAEEALRIPNEDKAVHKESRAFAIDLLDKIEIEDSRSPALIDRLARNYNLAGAVDRAIGVYDKALERFPDSLRLRLGLADLCLRNEKWELAEKQLNYLVGRRPDAAGGIYVQLAHIAIERKDYATAERHYEKALLFDPDTEATYYELARLQSFEDNEKKALATLARAREKFPPSFSMEYTAAVIHQRKDRYAEATESFVAAEKLAKAAEPERLTHFFYHEMGAAFERDKQFRKAEEYFRIGLKIEPEFAETLNYMGYMWTELDINLLESEDLIQKAIDQEPENAAFLDSMAWVLYKLGRSDAALEWQLKAVRFAKEADKVLYDHLGDIYAGLGRLKEAREAWRRAIEVEADEAISAKLGILAEGKSAPATP